MPAKRSYPTFSLPEALQRMRQLYEEEPHNEMTSEAAAQLLGFKGKNGTSLTAIATLRRYGLLEGRGDKIKVSPEALTIFADEGADDQSSRAEAIHRCAIMPAMFAEIYTAFKNVPSPPTLTSFLVKRGLSQSEAIEVSSYYRATMEFVEQNSGEYNSSKPGEIMLYEDPPMNASAPSPMPASPSARSVQIPLSANTWATLMAPFPLTGAAWDQMMGVLNAMKPALIRSDLPAIPGADGK